MTATPHTETFQIPLEAAEVYEAVFVPGFFAQWAPVLCDAAGIKSGDRVLDVGCGTGIVARTAADRVGPDGAVVGVDLNAAMLTVARRVRADLEWREGDVARLPFADGGFDAVVSQMALMFFPDRVHALAEMARVATPAGTVAVLVPASLDAQPAFVRLVELAGRIAGPDAASLLTTYFSCGDLDRLGADFRSAGLDLTSSDRREGVYRAPSAEAMVTTEVESTPLGQRISDEAYRRLRDEAPAALAPFTMADGAIDAPFAVNVVVGRRHVP